MELKKRRCAMWMMFFTVQFDDFQVVCLFFVGNNMELPQGKGLK